jgi:hypothetical protein
MKLTKISYIGALFKVSLYKITVYSVLGLVSLYLSINWYVVENKWLYIDICLTALHLYSLGLYRCFDCHMWRGDNRKGQNVLPCNEPSLSTNIIWDIYGKQYETKHSIFRPSAV